MISVHANGDEKPGRNWPKETTVNLKLIVLDKWVVNAQTNLAGKMSARAIKAIVDPKIALGRGVNSVQVKLARDKSAVLAEGG